MDIYEKHNATFRNVNAHIVVRNGQRVATVAFKQGTSCQAYVHWIGSTMTRGTANGGGYDRASAACASAARRARHGGDANAKAFWDALRIDGGRHWYQELERAGFDVWQAV